MPHQPSRPYFDLAAPGGVAKLLAFHKSVFGDVRMEDPPAPADPPADPPAPPTGVTLDGETFNFPEATQVAQMTSEQQVEYWRHKARKHENSAKSRADYDQQKAAAEQWRQHQQANATDIDKARTEARQQAEQETAARYQNRLVEQQFHISAAGRVATDVLGGYLADVDLAKFRGADGEPDIDRIAASVARLVPAAPGTPPPGHFPPGSYAGGNVPPNTPTGRDQGLAEAQRRFGDRK